MSLSFPVAASHPPSPLPFARRWVKQETDISRESQELDSRPKLDLGFKEGQTIKLNIGVRLPWASFGGGDGG